MGEAKRKEAKGHVLVGRALHRKNVDGIVEQQGVILEVIPSGDPVVGNVALVQYFDWVVGNPYNEELVPLAEMATNRERWTLYDSCEGMTYVWDNCEKERSRAYWRKKREEEGG